MGFVTIRDEHGNERVVHASQLPHTGSQGAAVSYSQWQPIAGAPKQQHVLVSDGTYVVVSVWGKVSHVPIYGWLDLYSDVENIDLLSPHPTHWMPLPYPP